MFGCLRRLGCLVLILILAACALWLTRDRWRSRVPHIFGNHATQEVVWHDVTTTDAPRARSAVQSLGRTSGPVFVNLTPEELGALILSSAGNRLPSSITNPQLAFVDDRVFLRATILLDDIRGLPDLGPLASIMNRREPFEARGTLDIVHPGLAEYRVESAKIGDLSLPRPAIPRLLARASRGERYEGVAENGLPFEVPSYIADVRVARGRVTLYKNVQ